MLDADEENVWFECLAHAKEFYGYWEAQQPPAAKHIEDAIALADRLYKRMKEATATYRKGLDPNRTVTQLKS